MNREAPWPVPRTLAASILAAAAALLIWGYAPHIFPRTHMTILGLGLFSAVFALFLGRALHLGTAWLTLSAIAAPSLVLVPIYQPPVWIFPAIVLLLGGFYINGVREKVPLYLSNRRTQQALAAFSREQGANLFIDLGSGLGSVVQAVARHNPETRVIGVETAPLSFLIAWLRLKLMARTNSRIIFRSIWDTDVSNADIVYAFLSPAPMTRLHEKLKAEMKTGAVFVSNSFAVPGDEPDEIIQVDDTRQTQLLIWRM
jgi:hypothetical protein